VPSLLQIVPTLLLHAYTIILTAFRQNLTTSLDRLYVHRYRVGTSTGGHRMSDSRIGIAGGKGVIEPVDVVEGEATGIVDVDVDGGSKDEVQREDPRAELRAMEAIAEALEPLTRSGRARVLRWATDHYGSCELPPTTSPAPRSSVTVPARSTGNATSSLDAFTDLADLFAAAQ